MSFGGFQNTSSGGMFGTPKPAATGFGGFSSPATSTPTFGLGQTATPVATGFGTGLQFGAPQSTPTFGAPIASQPSNIGFGLTTSTASTGFSGGLSFGAPAATTVPSLFGTTPSFGVPASAPAPGLNFNLGTTPAAPTSTGLSFGASTATSLPSTGFAFGAKTTGGLAFGTTTAPALSFGTAATTAPTLGFNVNPTTAAGAFTLGGIGGLLGSASTAVGLTTATSTTTVGLGGVDSAQSKLGLSGSGVTEPKQVKDHALPDPIFQNFNDFQAFVKQQKSISVDIAHSSAKPLKKVQEDIDNVESLLANIKSGLARNSVATEKLKTETAQGLFHADMAQRLRENPGSLAYEGGPEQFFNELVFRFETDAERLLTQVETAERHLRSITQSSAISPQELTLAMRRLHETLVVLAARTQSLHLATQGVEAEYRHLRHVYLKEDLPAPPKTSVTPKRSSQRSLAGPTPFSETSGMANLTVDALSMLTGANMPLAPTTTNTGWLGSQTPGTALMASPGSSFTSPLPVENSPFQLSKPPVGNKRNKR